MGKFIDLTGKSYGDLIVIECAGRDEWGQTTWRCLCKCGNETIVTGYNLRSGRTKSCGCYARGCARERSTTHGMSGTRQYNIWCGMLERCENENDPDYPRYGGRGIKVCERWHKFENFWEDMKEGYADDLTLERKYVNGDYCPENCCWATDEDQQNNKRNNIYLTINGETQTLARCVKDPEINIYNLDYDTAKARKRYGYSDEEIFSTPLRDDRVLINGKYQSLSQHIKDPEINIYNLGESTVKYRMYKMKLSAEKALSTPPRGKRNKTTSSP